jgi:hypothetical protein
MNFTTLLSALGFAAIKSQAQAAARTMGRRFAFAFATGLLTATAIGFGIGAFTVWLAGEIGTIWALLVVAGILLLLAVIVQVIGASLDKPRRRAAAYAPAPPRRADVSPDPDAAVPPPGSEVGAMAVVAVIGFLLARQLFRRRTP